MRVISGTAKGRRLAGPRRGDPMRPVLDQVKEAIFSILFDVTEAVVLDCFAGTGSLGIEALSRGAARAVFIDASPHAVALIRTNLEHCGFGARATVLPLSIQPALRRLAHQGMQFDLIFVDPPYEHMLVTPSLAALAAGHLLRSGGQVIIEHHPHELPLAPPGYYLADQRKYGQTRVSFIRKSA